MEINREFWNGTTVTVDDGSSAQNERYTYITDTLYSSIVANSEKYGGVWDKTICPWKINGNADIMQTEFVLPWYDGANWNVSKSDYHKKRKKGYTFYLSCNGSNFQDRYDNDLYFANYCGAWLSMPSTPNYDITDTVCKEWTESKFDRINPIINFDYANIFIVPTVNGNELTPNLANNFDPTTIYNIGFALYYKDYSGTNRTMSAAVVSLNNEIDVPSWADYNTNCFDISGMYDNGFMLTPYWVEHTNFHTISALGTRANAQSIPWRTRTEEFITGATGTGFSNTTVSIENTAATINYFPNKAVYISTGKSELWNNYEVYYDGGSSGYQYAVRRHLKSTVTYDDFINYIAKECAYLGFRFLIDSTKINEDINSQYYYIPEIDNFGVTTGNYYVANSSDAENLPNYQWSNNVYSVTPYDGTNDEEDEDPNEYDDNTTVLNEYGNRIYQEFTQRYILDNVTMKKLATFLYTTIPAELDSISWSPKNFLTNNPIDVILSLQFFPFDVRNYQTEEVALRDIYLGTQKAEVNEHDIQGYVCADNVVIINFGERLYYPVFGVDDFRSYPPYSTAELYLPYCGSISLDPEIYLNHYIRIKYLVDLLTGSCLALIYRDGMVIDSVSGQIGITVPLTGIQTQTLASAQSQANAQYKTARNNAVMKTAGSVGAIAAGIGSGNAMMIGGGIAGLSSAYTDIQNMNYQLQHTEIPFKTVGVSTSSTSYANEQTPRIIIKRPVMLPTFDAEKYGHSVGYATLETDVIRNYSGYTEITGVDLSGISATDEEKALIKKYLESGVYL